MAAQGKKVAETPLMKQYNAIKRKHPDALLLFRVGDFYETFGDDAIKASKILGIVLTKRANGAAAYVELAGFPHHSLETYLPKLVRAGQRVAICDQLEDPKMVKGIVKRGVTELVTPGVSFSDKILEQNENNFLAAIHLNGNKSGLSFLDISTGEFFVAEGDEEYMAKLLQGFKPQEVVLQKSKLTHFTETFGGKFYTATFDEWVFTEDFALDLLLNHFQVSSLKGFGIDGMSGAIVAAGAALHYLAETHHDKTGHICSVSRIEREQYVWLDRFTIRNLELISPLNPDGISLLDVLDQTTSPMGSRLLKRWMVLPLKDIAKIKERQGIVAYFASRQDIASEIKAQLKQMGDTERLISRVAAGKVGPKEVVALKNALFAVAGVKSSLASVDSPSLRNLADQLDECADIRDRIAAELNEEVPAQVQKGNVFAEGVNEELDELRKLAFSGKDYLVQIQQREIERTGIPSLKIGYNNVFGYYLEVTNAHKDKVPPEWHRKQTLVNSERYITEELKDYEQKILGAEEKILVLETRMFNDLVIDLAKYVQPVQKNSYSIARLDVLMSFAQIAVERNFVCPALNDGFVIDIKGGRHPVIEQQLPAGEKYISNDVYLDNQKQQIIMITGPNMSGKSALLRQTALIVLMAQMGSFVPAAKADIGMVDKVFTRVGASDNISSGESTFMVEMNETASILNNISNRSLILLDEIGRGTSTYDGISIAWAIAEYLHEHPGFRAKVLFATHYHELNEMAKSFKRIKNYHVTVKEINNKVIFLRKLSRGGSEHSFGIHVARMAGMPSPVLNTANQMLRQLEGGKDRKELGKKSLDAMDDMQLSFIQLEDPLLLQMKEDILNTDINTLTPVEALMKLNEIKKLINK